MMPQEYIVIRGARENNLKNVTLRIPKRKITVFTGVSGSGKSSIVFDTIGAEAQRLLSETLTAFIRNRMPKHEQPEADSIENISPAMVIDQKRLGGNARSTVGTITDIYALLHLLYSRVGTPFVGYSHVFSFNDPAGMCPECQGIGKKNRAGCQQNHRSFQVVERRSDPVSRLFRRLLVFEDVHVIRVVR